jgi:predicted transcriptional regulator
MDQETSENADLIRFMTYRSDLIEALAARQMDKRDITNELDVSESTVYKALNRFQDGGIIDRRSDGEYTLTILGELLLNLYQETTELLETQQLLNVLPEEMPFPVEVLEEAEFWVYCPESPYSPLTKLEELLATSNTLRLICGYPSYRSLRVLRRQDRNQFDTLECIFADSHLERLLESYPEALRANIERPNQTYYESSDVFQEFGIGLSEDVLYIAVYNGFGHIKGLIKNDTVPAMSWGEEAFEESKRSASEITATSF